MTDEQEFFTKEKFEELTKELDFLKKTKRKEIAENLENKIAKLEMLLKTGEIIAGDKKIQSGGAVSVGSTVTVEKIDNSERKIFHIVGGEESDVSGGKISIHSPMGEALAGKRKGESIIVKTPKGPVNYKVVEVK